MFCNTKCSKVILLQSVTDCYYTMRQVLQSVTDCHYKMRQVLQSVALFNTKWIRYYKVWQLLQSETWHLCVVSAISMLLGLLLFFDCFICCILFLSCSICFPFEVNVWLVFELLVDGIFPCLCRSFLGFCTSNFPRTVCGSFATLVLLVLHEMMWLLCFTLFAPDTAFAYGFLNAVGSLVGYNVSSLWSFLSCTLGC